MKKTLSILLASLTIFTATACTKSTTTLEANTNNTEAANYSSNDIK